MFTRFFQVLISNIAVANTTQMHIISLSAFCQRIEKKDIVKIIHMFSIIFIIMNE